ncbi:uncharacterized protein [Anabrus simplex]|uniref:uncharacterized protein n=1 Tax=Anabrus simplex TaxID=316456 RepID=UPI0034DD25E4
MPILDDVLRKAPKYWEDALYEDKRYVMFEIHPGDEEYQEVIQLFQGEHISSVERVQHPYAYGRFMLRKEQYQMRHGSCSSETTEFHPVFAQDVGNACEFNCDCRRYSRQVDASGCETRKPKFYSRARAAINSLRSYGGQKAIIVVGKIGTYSDTEYYPKYAVYLN